MSGSKDVRINCDDVEFMKQYKSSLPMVKNVIVQDLASIKKLDDLERVLSTEDEFNLGQLMSYKVSNEFKAEIGFAGGYDSTFSAAKFEGLMTAIKKAYQDQQNLSVEQMRTVYQNMKKMVLAQDAEKKELERNTTEALAATNNMLIDAQKKLRLTAGATKEKLNRVTETINAIVEERRKNRDKEKVDIEKLQRVYYGNPEEYYGH